MKVKATTNFAGEVCMATGEVRDVPENIAAPLLKCGYLELAEPEKAEEPETIEEPEKVEGTSKKKSAKANTEG